MDVQMVLLALQETTTDTDASSWTSMIPVFSALAGAIVAGFFGWLTARMQQNGETKRTQNQEEEQTQRFEKQQEEETNRLQAQILSNRELEVVETLYKSYLQYYFHSTIEGIRIFDSDMNTEERKEALGHYKDTIYQQQTEFANALWVASLYLPTDDYETLSSAYNKYSMLIPCLEKQIVIEGSEYKLEDEVVSVYSEMEELHQSIRTIFDQFVGNIGVESRPLNRDENEEQS